MSTPSELFIQLSRDFRTQAMSKFFRCEAKMRELDKINEECAEFDALLREYGKACADEAYDEARDDYRNREESGE